MQIYDMRTEDLKRPLGVDNSRPRLSWKLASDRLGAKQTSYTIEISKTSDFTEPIWINSVDSPDNFAFCSVFDARTRYFWRVKITDENGDEFTSGTEWFETGVMDEGWHGAKWIGAPYAGTNADVLDDYSVDMTLCPEENSKIGIAIAARNKDNYTLIEIDLKRSLIIMKEYTDNARDGGDREIFQLGGFAFPVRLLNNAEFEISIRVKRRRMTLVMNGEEIISDRVLIPENRPNRPRKAYCMLFGLKQERGRVVYKHIKITDMSGGEPVVLQEDDFKDSSGALSMLGKVTEDGLSVKKRFELINPVPPLNLRKKFTVRGRVRSARLYASARGFYDIYINGEKFNTDFYNPGFTDYRERVEYQTYDITGALKDGENTLGAIVSKNHYSGFCGYSGAMNYGRECSFIAFAAIRYEDGTEDIFITDERTDFTDRGPVINSDYFDGESYDARFTLDWENGSLWRGCGVKEGDPGAKLTARTDCGARLETALKAVSVTEAPKGHFVYDFGQNMVGTVRIKLCGERGKSIKVRYAEICRRKGGVYLENLRTAANTDTFTMSGGDDEFIPSFTAHGFRYAEITGNGYTLKDSDIILSVEGLVINNTDGVTGSFECSNELVNKLQSNILWGERGNSLLVFTDCPQRNERMGWTGDMTAFASTGVYNMNIKALGVKWLRDLRDAQKMYDKDRAVPDTAPLGGDNRPDGCTGWGDASVIVPWEMYKAYGDVRILEENYDMMRGWLEYQNMPDQRNYGVRTVNGKEVPEQSDLAREPYIQAQQRRGDHLAVDSSTPFILSATAYAAHSCDIMSRIAALLGRDEDAEMYAERFEKIKRAFNDAWVKSDGSIAYWGEMSLDRTTLASNGGMGANRDGSSINMTYYSETGRYRPSQTAYALAIAFDLIPPEIRGLTYEFLNRSVERNANKLSVGFLGIAYLTPALTMAGHADTAYKLLLQEENPGWLYSVKNGATTVWERWDSYIAKTDTFGSPLMNSFNHYAYGAVGSWMYKTILGIDSADGYKNIIFRPVPGGGFAYAKGALDSPYGEVKSSWEIQGDKTVFRFTVPVGAKAEAYLPDGSKHVLESGKYEFRI